MKIAAHRRCSGAILGENLGGVDSESGSRDDRAQTSFQSARKWGLAISGGAMAGLAMPSFANRGVGGDAWVSGSSAVQRDLNSRLRRSVVLCRWPFSGKTACSRSGRLISCLPQVGQRVGKCRQKYGATVAADEVTRSGQTCFDNLPDHLARRGRSASSQGTLQLWSLPRCSSFTQVGTEVLTIAVSR